MLQCTPTQHNNNNNNNNKKRKWRAVVLGSNSQITEALERKERKWRLKFRQMILDYFLDYEFLEWKSSMSTKQNG
jgi:hypothetical protein